MPTVGYVEPRAYLDGVEVALDLALGGAERRVVRVELADALARLHQLVLGRLATPLGRLQLRAHLLQLARQAVVTSL